LRRFAFEKMLPFQAHVWHAIKAAGTWLHSAGRWRLFSAATWPSAWWTLPTRNAQRAGRGADAVQLRGGDALQRMPPVGAAWRDAAEPALW
jgi:putative N6-adenine-specific DNA methylase